MSFAPSTHSFVDQAVSFSERDFDHSTRSSPSSRSSSSDASEFPDGHQLIDSPATARTTPATSPVPDHHKQGSSLSHNLLKKSGGPGSLVFDVSESPSPATRASPAERTTMSFAARAPPPAPLPTIKRNFDPFAPLPSNNNGHAFSAAPALLPMGSSLTPAAPESRRTSLYLPLEPPTASGDASSWPFSQSERLGSNAEEMLFARPVSPGAQPPKSPSMINAAYGIPPPATPPPSSSRRSPRMETVFEDAPESPPPRDRSASPPPLRGNRRPGPPNATPTMSTYATFSPETRVYAGPVMSTRKMEANQHTSRYSVGTQSLLSSRLPVSSRLAKAIDTPTSWLIMYFGFNLGLTLYNKLVLQGFPFPWTLTGIQMLAGTLGTQVALNMGFFTQATLSVKEIAIMLAFSFLYTINIAVSNLSLHLVTVPFHQVVRAMTPLFTIALSVAFFHKRYSKATYLSLMPVVFGVAFATYGDYYFTTWGLILTMLGTLLAALKTIVTNRMQVGRLKLHPLDLLIRMSPLAFMQCVLWGWYSGELERVRAYGATQMTQGKALALVMNGVIAFGLNVVSFTANKKTSALTMTVSANVKQVLTIVLAVVIFHITLNATNLFGITLTLAGGAWYAAVELQEKSRPKPVLASSSSMTTSLRQF